MTEIHYSWTQPLCDHCYERREPNHPAHRIADPLLRDVEHCCDCGDETASGIYYRIDPATALHPTLTKD